MSTQDPPSPQGACTAKVAKRRANSCVPCRVSKSRCSGGIPCSTCQKKRGKPRCWYRNVLSKDDDDSEQSKTSPFEQDQKEGSQSTVQTEPEDTIHDRPEQSLPLPHYAFYGAFSLARYVDKFKSLSPPDGPVDDIIKSIQTVEVFNCKFNDEEKSRIFDQTHQGSTPSRMNLRSLLVPDADRLLSGNLYTLYHKFLDAQQLLDAGMVAEAWSALASIVRDAELLGLEEDDGTTDTADQQPSREPGRRIWWLFVELDAKLSFLLGRRPLISSSHAVPRPSVDCSRQEERDLLQNLLDFAQYMLEVLGDVIPDRSSPKTESEVEKTTLESYLHRLQDLNSGFSYLPQNGKTDPLLWAAIAEHQFQVQLFMMVLNCQILKSTALGRTQKPSEGRTPSSSKPKRPQLLRKHSSKTYLEEMFQSLRRITSLFEYINALDPSPVPPWPRCFGVYCAVSVLGIARLRQDIDPIQTDTDRIQELLKFFQGSLKRSPRSAIAQAAVSSLGKVLGALDKVEDQPVSSAVANKAPEPHSAHPPAGNQDTSNPSQSRSFTHEPAVDKTSSAQHLKRPNPSQFEDDRRPEKRQSYSVMPPSSYETSVQGHPPAWQGDQGPPSYAQQMTSFGEMSAASFHESSVQHSFDQGSFAPSAPASFNANEQLQYASFGYSTGHTDSTGQLHTFPFWMHPPMLIHPPMYHSGWQAMDPGMWMVPDSGQQAFYGGPSAMTVGDPRQHDGNVQTSQSANMNSYEHAAAASRAEAQATGNMTVPGDSSRGPNDGQFYATAPVQYQCLDHPASSPIRDDGFPHQESAFGLAPPMDRRRSAADISSQQNSSWAMEMQADYASQNSMSDQRDNMPDSQTPSRDGLLSPVSETEAQSQSRRNSATPRQIARKGRPPPPPRPKQSDAPAPNMDTGDANGLRRRSIAHAGDVMMTDGNSRVVEQQPDPRAVEQQHQQQQHVWPNRAPNASSGHHPPGSNLYSMNMAGQAHAMQYEQNFDPHLPPRPVVTTGPFTGNAGGQHWWTR